jgi:hypothetical protein
VETLELELGDFSRRIGSVVVSHHATALTRGLEPGETVRIHDASGEELLGRVADISFSHTDTYYRLELRGAAPVPLEVADVVAMVRDLARQSQHRLYSA